MEQQNIKKRIVQKYKKMIKQNKNKVDGNRKQNNRIKNRIELNRKQRTK